MQVTEVLSILNSIGVGDTLNTESAKEGPAQTPENVNEKQDPQ